MINETKKKITKTRLVAFLMALIIVLAVISPIFNTVFANGNATIQINGMSSVADGYASYSNQCIQEKKQAE